MGGCGVESVVTRRANNALCARAALDTVWIDVLAGEGAALQEVAREPYQRIFERTLFTQGESTLPSTPGIVLGAHVRH